MARLNVTWGSRHRRASLPVNSCSAPNGHSQPQKVPRPHSSSDTSTKAHSATVSGSCSKNARLGPDAKAWITPARLTIDSCACA